jgi:hypothetical protein
MLLSANATIAPEGLVLAICDAESPMARTSLNREAWDFGKTTPEPLFGYNTFLSREMEQGHGLCWILVLWGVYRLELRLHTERLPRIQKHGTLIGNTVTAPRLRCPSGRLVIVDVESSATATPTPFATIPPGDYAALFEDAGIEGQHWDLTNPSQYPKHEGPEWIVHLAADR